MALAWPCSPRRHTPRSTSSVSTETRSPERSNTSPTGGTVSTSYAPGPFSYVAGGQYELLIPAQPTYPPTPFTARSSGTSSVTPTLIHFQTSWEVQNYVLTGGGSSAHASVNLDLDVEFEVTTPTAVSLQGTTRDSAPWWNGREIRLRRVGGASLFLFTGDQNGSTIPVSHNYSAVLEPGTYRYTIAIIASTGKSGLMTNLHSTGWADITLTLPTPGAVALMGMAGLAGLRRRRA